MKNPLADWQLALWKAGRCIECGSSKIGPKVLYDEDGNCSSCRRQIRLPSMVQHGDGGHALQAAVAYRKIMGDPSGTPGAQ